MKKTKHPMQPIVLVDGVARFHRNRIVERLLDILKGKGIGLNEIAVMFDRLGADNDDYQQLMQLIGYSVSGYGDLSSHDPAILAEADFEVEKMLKEET